MSFSIGIVGLPNVGKSTLFKALTKKSVLIANYPFATIDPNVGIVEVPDQRLKNLAEISKSEKIIPTVIEFYDIAGLVKGAHEGEGLGNKFLANIREVDAIVEVVRAFADPDVQHVHNKVDPKTDIDVISLELIMADLKTIEKKSKEVESAARGGDKQSTKIKVLLDKVKLALEKGQWARTAIESEDEKALIKDLHLLTTKPILYVYNIDEKNIPHPTPSPNGRGQGEGHIDLSLPGPRVVISAKIEAELADLPVDEAKSMMSELGMDQSGLDKLIVASYKLLNLITFLTSGPKETRAWTIKRGTKAPQAASVIHTDFEKGFIRAEIIKYNDFINNNGEAGAKEKGLMRVEGKEYEMQDGDVCYFRVAA